MPTPPLKALRCFETVARLGSFKAAAGQLHVTQSAVSHQIRALEEWLGQPVFAREAGGVRLLPPGERLAQRLALAFTEIDSACAEARARGGAPLTVAAIPSAAMCWLIPRLSAFRQAHPGIELRIVYAMHGVLPDFGAVQVALTFAAGPPVLADVRADVFLPGDSLPVCRPDLLDRLGRRPRAPEDFLRLGLLHDSDPAGWSEWLSMRPPLPGPIFQDFNLLRSAALAGQGAALCPLAMIRPDIEAGFLTALSDTPRPVGSDYYLLTRTRAPQDLQAKVAVFRDWVLAEAGTAGAVRST